jgi:copper chaperone CopZ
MKNTIKIILPLLCIGLFAFQKPPKKATVSFKVSGACGMCKDRIETALDKPGISKAKWEKTSQTVTITYNPRKLEEIQLHNLIAIAGHDTEKVKALVKAYEELPDCCKYRDGKVCDD